jgi:meso-butanediol dehydrogenase/(S,S)-butanediol dehydrogenase/diacetyl reductase
MAKFSGDVAIVTGAARGIGRGIAEVLAREGARVVAGDLDAEGADETVKLIAAAGGEAFPLRIDVTDPESAANAVSAALARYGRLDILANNAGVFGEHATADASSSEDWDMCYEVNLKGIWVMSRAVAPHFVEQRHGKIVNTASIGGRRGGPGIPHYCASKAGAINLTQSLALELGPHNINVNAVCPGLVRTYMWTIHESLLRGDRPKSDGPDVFDKALAARCPLRREQTPEDIGMAVAFLASSEARNITGQSLNVDGGMVLN